MALWKTERWDIANCKDSEEGEHIEASSCYPLGVIIAGMEWSGRKEGRRREGRGRDALEESFSGWGLGFFSLTEMKQALEYAWGESGK